MGRQRHAAVSPPATAGPADARFVTALARGIEVLRAFQPQDRWLAHGEIVRRIALPAATVSRLTYTLSRLGYLRHRPATGEYALGTAVLGLGFSMLNNFDIGRVARPHMQQLADRCQAAVSLGARHELNMIYVAHCRSAARLILGLDVGARLPLATTAMGRAVLCAMVPAERAALVDRLVDPHVETGRGADIDTNTATGAATAAAMRESLARAELQFGIHGFVTSEAEWEPGISAVGVVLRIGDGRPPLGLTVGGASASLPGRLLRDEVGPALLGTAERIAAEIHAAGWTD